MQELITKNYNGFEIQFEIIDGLVMANATTMCAPFGKKPTDWLKTAAAKRFILAKSKSKKINLAAEQMVNTVYGGAYAGTWVHESLVLKLAAWLDVDFEVQCDEWLTELSANGRVELAPAASQSLVPQDPDDLILMLAQRNAEHSRELRAIKAEQEAARIERENNQQQLASVEQKIEEVAARQVVTEIHFFTIAGWANLQHKSVGQEEAKRLGQKAKALSVSQGLPTPPIPSGLWGKVNTYHRSILQQIM